MLMMPLMIIAIVGQRRVRTKVHSPAIILIHHLILFVFKLWLLCLGKSIHPGSRLLDWGRCRQAGLTKNSSWSERKPTEPAIKRRENGKFQSFVLGRRFAFFARRVSSAKTPASVSQSPPSFCRNKSVSATCCFFHTITEPKNPHALHTHFAPHCSSSVFWINTSWFSGTSSKHTHTRRLNHLPIWSFSIVGGGGIDPLACVSGKYS